MFLTNQLHNKAFLAQFIDSQFQTPASNGCSTGKNWNSDFSSWTWQSQALEISKHDEARELPKRDPKKKVDLDDFEILGYVRYFSFILGYLEKAHLEKCIM